MTHAWEHLQRCLCSIAVGFFFLLIFFALSPFPIELVFQLSSFSIELFVFFPLVTETPAS